MFAYEICLVWEDLEKRCLNYKASDLGSGKCLHSRSGLDCEDLEEGFGRLVVYGICCREIFISGSLLICQVRDDTI